MYECNSFHNTIRPYEMFLEQNIHTLLLNTLVTEHLHAQNVNGNLKIEFFHFTDYLKSNNTVSFWYGTDIKRSKIQILQLSIYLRFLLRDIRLCPHQHEFLNVYKNIQNNKVIDKSKQSLFNHLYGLHDFHQSCFLLE